jgi:hypothetical protein
MNPGVAHHLHRTIMKDQGRKERNHESKDKPKSRLVDGRLRDVSLARRLVAMTRAPNSGQTSLRDVCSLKGEKP